MSSERLFYAEHRMRHDVEGNILLPPAHSGLRTAPRKTSREAGLHFCWKKTKISISRSALQCKCSDLYHSVCHRWWQIYLSKPCYQIELQVSPFLRLCSQQNLARNKTRVSQKPPLAHLVVEGSGSSCAPWHHSSLDWTHPSQAKPALLARCLSWKWKWPFNRTLS